MEIRHKIEIMLARSTAAQRANFHRAVEAALPSLDGVTLAFAMPGNVLEQSAQGASGAGLPAIDALIEVSAPVETPLAVLTHRLTGIGARLIPDVDLSRSGILAGTEYTVMPGNGPVRLFCPLTRLKRLSRQEFQDYWLGTHAEFGRRPDNRYRQFHSDDSATVSAAAAAGIPPSHFDGVALAFFDDVEHLKAKLASPEIAREAYADEQRFIDHARSQFLPFSAGHLST